MMRPGSAVWGGRSIDSKLLMARRLKGWNGDGTCGDRNCWSVEDEILPLTVRWGKVLVVTHVIRRTCVFSKTSLLSLRSYIAVAVTILLVAINQIP